MMGAQTSKEQKEKISSYLEIGQKEGAEILTGGRIKEVDGDMEGGYYFEPTIFKGDNTRRIVQEEIFGPVLAVATSRGDGEARAIADDTLYGLGAGVWTRCRTKADRFGSAIQAGRVWVNTYHDYPAHAAFGGYKMSGIGRENHLMMLSHYQQTKNLLVSYSESPKGFF